MKVRGITVVTRKMIVTRQFGGEAWAGFYRDLSGAHSCFRQLVTADTLLPLPAYLAFHDELVRRFWADDERSHFALGQQSARWALVDGPYKTFMDKPDLGRFVRSFPELWEMYFSDTHSRSEVAMHDDGVDFKAFELPKRHPYLEHFIVGYMKEVLELFCANPITATKLDGGHADYHWLIHKQPHGAPRALDDAAYSGDEGSRPGAVQALSDRETEVLLLLARGKSNKEIGGTLGISAKTVQHHVSHSYRKIGINSRVGAAMWLARRGLAGR
jgi:DNA-binding CsgD family transcriptional regulator